MGQAGPITLKLSLLSSSALRTRKGLPIVSLNQQFFFSWKSVHLYSISLIIPSDRLVIRMLCKTSSSVHALRNPLSYFLIWGIAGLFFHFVCGVQVSSLVKCLPCYIIIQLKKKFLL